MAETLIGGNISGGFGEKIPQPPKGMDKLTDGPGHLKRSLKVLQWLER